MEIKKARKLLGETYKTLADDEIEKIIHTGEVFANAILDIWFKMTPEERKKWETKNVSKSSKKKAKSIS